MITLKMKNTSGDIFCYRHFLCDSRSMDVSSHRSDMNSIHSDRGEDVCFGFRAKLPAFSKKKEKKKNTHG
jgi:hypothetical protein